MKRKIIAPDGFVYMGALRLLGLTLGVTITRECSTAITPPAGSSAPAASSPSQPQSVQLPPELLAQIQAHIQAQASTKALSSPSIPGKST
jgi:hypothetical protein